MPVKCVASSLQDTLIRGTEGSPPTQVIDLQFKAPRKSMSKRVLFTAFIFDFTDRLNLTSSDEKSNVDLQSLRYFCQSS